MNNESWKWDAEAAFEKIAAHEEGRSWCSNGDLDKKAMAAPYTPPPNVAAWLKAQADKPKPHGRDIEALMRYHRAHERDIGYWEDAPRGMKFGESANGRPADFESASEGSSPSSPATTPPAGDEFEPVGTMPIVGDECVKVSHIQIGVGEHIEVDVGLRITITGPKRDSPFGEVFDHDRNISGIYAECFRRGSWRILKRTMGL